MNNTGGMNLPASGLKTSLKSIYDFSGKALATTTDFEPWELEPDQSDMLAEQTDQIVIEFFPTITSKVGKILILVVSLIGVYGAKWLKFEKHLADKRKKEQPSKDANGNDIKVNTEPLKLDNE